MRKGLASVRGGWITGRGDVEHYEGRAPVALDDGQKSEDATRLAQLRAEAAALQRKPLRAKAGANVTQMHYAKKGIITPRWNTWPSAKTASASGWSNTWPTEAVKSA